MIYSVPLALQDYMTVFFSAAGLILLTRMVAGLDRDLGRMALIGSVLVVAGGFSKATWKLVVAAGGPDLTWLGQALFPLIAPGFTLLAWSLYQMRRFFRDQPALRRPWLVPALVIGLCGAAALAIGVAGGPWRVVLIMLASVSNIGLLLMLSVAAWRRGMRGTSVLFFITLVVVLVMSQMAQMTFDRIEVVWFEQIAQTVAQMLFALGAWQYGQEIAATYRPALAAQAA